MMSVIWGRFTLWAAMGLVSLAGTACGLLFHPTFWIIGAAAFALLCWAGWITAKNSAG